eukprot:CAMPEP_0172705104 /NCGR_PEP_ID=MMETSP1074-20121228/42377_1 /TAXON_ID=2916 /ORGANISM="Ceratium fusus, Strain PA161109" /LENGTH=31 /DNA_ID= /DNA_START= /DNA_END= /DNA_ORIENTATION=
MGTSPAATTCAKPLKTPVETGAVARTKRSKR